MLLLYVHLHIISVTNVFFQVPFVLHDLPACMNKATLKTLFSLQVGLMRNGQLLAEGPPDAVMKQHNAVVRMALTVLPVN